MKCPHCGEHFRPKWLSGKVSAYGDDFHKTLEHWTLLGTRCLSCGRETIKVLLQRPIPNSSEMMEQYFSVIPRSRRPSNYYPNAPEGIVADYWEACEVLEVSSKAAAAIARRCLQAILWEQGYNQKDLAQQIDALLAEEGAHALPRGLADNVDAVRNFGNFSAHRINDKTTFQVIDVEPEEAEWCLEIIEELLDHYYERPAELAEKQSKLQDKLQRANKPEPKAPAQESPSSLGEDGESEESR